MACIVENYNLALAPSASSALTLPGSLRAKLSVAVPETLFNVSPRPLHSLSQELCSSEYSLQSTSSQTSSSDCTAAEMSPARVPPRAVSIATRAEPSSLSGTADRLSQLGRPSAALAAHIHRSMRKREAVLPPLQLASPQLHKRTRIVDFLYSACETLQLTRNTRFLAMHMVDHFMDKHIVMDYRLKLVTLTCLLVAAKFEEHEDRMVCMEQLQIMAQCGENPDIYTKKEFLTMELYLLRFFEWSISHPTAINFVEYFLSVENVEEEEEEEESCCSTPPDSLPGSEQNRSERRAQVDRLTSCFLEASLRDVLFLQSPHSLIAAAAVCAARICLGLPTAWNHKLEALTGYNLNQISAAVDHMLKLFYNDCDV